MVVAKKTLKLPRGKDLKSNKLKDIQGHLQVLYDELDRAYRKQFSDIGRLEDGATVGQMLYFDGIHWVPIDTSKLIWSNANGTIGINDSTPNSNSKLDAKGIVMATRQLSGGVFK